MTQVHHKIRFYYKHFAYYDKFFSIFFLICYMAVHISNALNSIFLHSLFRFLDSIQSQKSSSTLTFYTIAYTHGWRNLAGYSRMGSQRVRHDWATNTLFMHLYDLLSSLSFIIPHWTPSLTSELESVCVFSRSVMSDSLRSPQTAAHQAHLSMVFPRQEYWSGLPFPPPGDLPDPRRPRLNPGLLHCRYFTILATREALSVKNSIMDHDYQWGVILLPRRYPAMSGDNSDWHNWGERVWVLEASNKCLTWILLDIQQCRGHSAGVNDSLAQNISTVDTWTTRIWNSWYQFYVYFSQS